MQNVNRWKGGVLLSPDGTEKSGRVRPVETDDNSELLPHSAEYKGKFLGILPSKLQAQEAVEEAAGLVSRRSFAALVGLGVFKARHKPVVYFDADMDPQTGKLTVGVPVEYQETVKVWLINPGEPGGPLLQNHIDYRATVGGIWPLPGRFKVRWMAHRTRHRVEF